MMSDFPVTNKLTSNFIFADDSCACKVGLELKSTIASFQKDLDVINDWCKKWGLILNPKKCKVIIFNKMGLKNLQFKLTIKN